MESKEERAQTEEKKNRKEKKHTITKPQIYVIVSECKSGIHVNR
jgi:hypothetical protein